ncbi:hypothetical protein [Micromonospora sp. DT229]|uniref:hypothetical protein n=1 Tax=Micromonospora sp. DT229 TaxID=3393430 RepID=UPI003CF973C3
MLVGDGGYQRWAAFLEQWRAGAAGDLTDLPTLVEQDYPAEVWLRLVTRLTDALAHRLQTWADALIDAMAATRDEFEMARALTQARRGLTTIRAVAGHPALPGKLARALRDQVDEQIRLVQRALEDGIDDARRAGLDDRLVEARLRTLRDNPLTVQDRSAAGTGWAAAPAQSGRRIIVDPPVRPT